MNFLNICDRKKSNLIYGGGWYRTSVLLLLVRVIWHNWLESRLHKGHIVTDSKQSTSGPTWFFQAKRPLNGASANTVGLTA